MFTAVKLVKLQMGERKTGHLLLRDRKLLVKIDNERYFFALCTKVHLFCVNLRVVMQYINLSVQDKKLRLLLSVSETLMPLRP